MSEPQFKVGGECDAWCGPCKRISDHVIVAMVDGVPKQVICQSCNNRHNYRTTPARAVDKPAVATREPAKLSPLQQLARKKQDELVALSRELAAAAEVRPFVRREIYKAGQIIDHPEYGRGKVESARRETIMVRFQSGLKSLLIT
jgi:hypothetical protein